MEKLKDRYTQMIIFFAIFIIVLVGRLFSLTIVEGDKYKEMADNKRIKKIPISAPRGEIRDRYGRVVAASKPSYTVQIMKNELIDEKLNEVSISLLNTLIQNGDKFVDDFPIGIENGVFYFTYDREVQHWLNEQGLENIKNAEEAFNLLRERLGIDPNMDLFEAQSAIQQLHGIYPPISVRTMKFIPEMQKENFLQSYKLDTTLEAKEAFEALKTKFKIPPNYSVENIRKILIVRHELREQGYRQYQPIKMAFNVSAKTVAWIEEKSMELPGVNIEIEPIRYYPNQELASHIIGYMSKISDSEKEKFVNQLGYAPNDLIGKDGIERTYETQLKGKDGAKYVEVDAYGRLINVLKKERPVKGNTVYLTIDSKLQKVAENSLKHALEQIQIGGSFESTWGNYKYNETFRNATTGAVVALDAKSGEVLALASYPSYNPNLFATGISKKDWDELQDKNPRDPLSPVPLLNIAARTAVQPGSTFKMVTGLAAIDQGLDPRYQMYDDGYIKLSENGRPFGCWLWNTKKARHGWVDLYRALEVSCNYYFYNVATGWDHFRNRPLPVSMNVNKLLEYTKKVGLDEPTGIEISETAYGVPNPEKKLKTTKAMLKQHIQNRMKDYFDKEVYNNKEELDKKINEIVSWADENPSRNEIIRRLEKVGIKKEKVLNLADVAKYTYFNQAKWNKGDTFNLSIGQGEHAYSPLQMARYIATIANGGYKNNVSVIKKVGNQADTDVQENTDKERIELNDYENLNHVMKGMEDVTAGDDGTAKVVFGNFPIKVAAKTGTAQRSGVIQPKDEVEYLRKYLKLIAPRLGFGTVEERAKEIMENNKERFSDEGVATRQAIKELSDFKISDAQLDQFKGIYDNFAWFVSYAPVEDPQIVVVSLIFQGGKGGYASPIVREIIAEYLGLNSSYEPMMKEKTLIR